MRVPEGFIDKFMGEGRDSENGSEGQISAIFRSMKNHNFRGLTARGSQRKIPRHSTTPTMFHQSPKSVKSRYDKSGSIRKS